MATCIRLEGYTHRHTLSYIDIDVINSSNLITFSGARGPGGPTGSTGGTGRDGVTGSTGRIGATGTRGSTGGI